MTYPHFTTVLLSLFGVFLRFSNCADNNVCRTYKDYYTIKNNPNCWYSVAASANATEIIKYYGYPLEIHKIITEDGYILTAFRIPNRNAALRKGPVFIHHPLYFTSACFLGMGKHSLAFLLSDAGYDVWLGNYRGTRYSEEHVTLTVKNNKYWDYSLDEIGKYDVPAVIEHISEKTGQRGNIIFIGHSLGTIAALIYGSEFPHQAKTNIKTFILLAPAAQLHHMKSPLRIFAPFLGPFWDTINAMGLARLVSHSSIQHSLIKSFCLQSPKLMELCINMINLYIGMPSQMDPELLPVFFNDFVSGTSFKVPAQIADSVNRPFSKFDYGKKNIKIYGTITPPLYNVTRIDVPIYMMYAISDWCCSKKDAIAIFNMFSPIGKSYGLHEVEAFNFNHGDFMYGRNVKSLVYDRIFKLLHNID